MARIHTYENDEVVRGGDKWIGSDAQSLNKTKNFTADKVAEYYALNGVMLSPNAVTLKYKEWQNPSGTPSGFFWSFTPVDNLVNVNSISSFGMSKKDLKVRFFDELLNSFEGHFVFFYNAVSPNNFAIFKLTGIQDHPDNANLFKIDVQFIDGNGSFTFEDSFFFGLLDRSVNYDDIDGVPTNLSEFTNDVGFITVDDLPNTLLTATQFSSNHTSGLGNGYLAGDVVYYQGRIYKAKFNNDAILPSVGGNTYWDDLGVGERLRQINADWNSTSGDSVILNKPTIPTQTSDLTNDGEDGINPFITAADVPNLTIQQVLNNGNTISDDTFIVYSDNGITSSYYANGEVGFTNTASGGSIAFTSGGILKLASNPSMFTSVGFITPTSNNVINFQNASGTLAFLTDIPSVTGYVPYTGATQDVDLGEYELKAGQIELDQSPTGTAGVAVTRWNNDIGSTETTLKGGSVVLKNGVDLVARVVNKVTPNTTLTKANYQVVRVSGAQGQRLAVEFAQANNDNNSADTLGVVIETIPTNQEGFIMTVGQIEDINTTGSLQGETWADGDVLYLSPTTPGAVTKVKPTGATGHIVVIGYVEYAHAIHGKIYIKVMNGWELDELHNVNISSPTNNQILAYTLSTQLWENKDVTTALGYTPQAELNGTGFVKASGTTITYDNSTYLTSSTVITNVEKNAYEYRCSALTGTAATQIGQPGAGIVTSGITGATQGGGKFKSQNRFNYVTSTVAGSLAFFRTTFGLISLNTGFVCEWLFGTADAATVAGARSFVGLTSSFATPNNVEPTTLVNCVGLARLSTSNNWHIIHNDASGVATSIDLGSGYPSNTLEIDLIYLRLTFNTDSTISYVVANKTTNISTSGTLSTNLPSVTLYETIWTTNNATALAARLGFCYRTFNNPY